MTTRLIDIVFPADTNRQGTLFGDIYKSKYGMTVLIRNLRLKTRIGVTDKERSAERDVVVNVSFDYNADTACGLDSIDQAIDYRKVRDRVATLVQSSQFMLIETLAQRLVVSLSEDQRIDRLRVEVEKPEALRLADSVSASLTWQRGA